MRLTVAVILAVKFAESILQSEPPEAAPATDNIAPESCRPDERRAPSVPFAYILVATVWIVRIVFRFMSD
jgi:hypothetical protein